MAKAKETQKKVQKELVDSAQKIWLAGLGALAVAEEEGSKLFKNLVEKGEKFESRGKKHVAKVKDRVEDARERAESTWESLGGTIDEKVADALNRLGVPSRDEIKNLTKKVEELTLKVDKLKPSTSTAKKA